jgi:hypothetical protein
VQHFAEAYQSYFSGLMKKILSLILLMFSIVLTGAWLVTSIPMVASKVMSMVWEPPKNLARTLSVLFPKGYVAIPTDNEEGASLISFIYKLNFWLDMSIADTFMVFGVDKGAVIVSKFGSFYDLKAYQKEALVLGIKTFINGEPINYISMPDQGAFIMFVPSDYPEYVLSFSNEKALSNMLVITP